jgi:hypothetical protein
VSPEPSTPRRRRPVFASVIVALNVLLLLLVVASIAGAEDCSKLGELERSVCENDLANGVVLLVLFWAAVDVVLGVLYVVTRRRP